MSDAATGHVDLAAKRLGGMVVAASDEFFGAKENLLEPGAPLFDPLAYGDRGKLMDGWETRRRRGPGADWCIVRLGVPGVVDAVAVDTTHFKGNHPAACELFGAACTDGSPMESAAWSSLLPKTDLGGDQVQRFDVSQPRRVTHVKFVVHPDGGVARLRLLGRPVVDLHPVADPDGRLDLAAMVNGGRVVACSDAFFSPPSNLIMVGDARDMGDGWETRRRRGPGHDWAVVELATTGVVERVEIDTTHFKGNYPDRCGVDGVDAPGGAVGADGWTTLVEPQPMTPHARHVFDVADPVPVSHLRLSLIPDGGVARLRAFGIVTDAGWQRAGLRLLDAMPDDQAYRAFLACCGSTAWARAMTAARPFDDPAALFRTTEEVWARLDDQDRLEAFAAHPRIGEQSASRWSQAEQEGARGADPAVIERLRKTNREYEERFGHVFLIRASGRSAAEMLAALEERLGNDADTEMCIATEQQRQITELRLHALLAEGTPG